MRPGTSTFQTRFEPHTSPPSAGGRLHSSPLRELIPLIVILILSLPAAVHSGTSMGLYYEGDFVKYRDDCPEWDLRNPAQRLLLNIDTNQPGGIEAYLGTEAYSNSKEQAFRLYQGHIRFRRRNWESFFFYRQDRHWVDSPLLNLVNTDRLKDDSWGPQAEGARLDFRDVKGVSGTVLASKYGTWDGEAYVARFTRLIQPSLRLSSLATFQDWRDGEGSYNGILSCSGELSTRKATIHAESAVSTENEDDSTLIEGASNYALHVEVRDLHLGSVMPIFSVFHYGRNFRANLSNRFNMANDKEFDRDGFFLQASWLMPARAVTLTVKDRGYWSNFRMEESSFLEERFYTNWYYTEAYLEFQRDITLKCWIEATTSPYDTWRHAFAELGAENSLGRIRFQLKLKDIGVHAGGYDFNKAYSSGQRELLGMELMIHLSRNTQFYQRTGFGHSVTGSKWLSGFYQIAYRGFSNTEIYFEYGNPDHTNDDLLNDNDLADNVNLDLEHRVKLFVKMWF